MFNSECKDAVFGDRTAGWNLESCGEDASTGTGKGIIEEYTTIINPQKISGAISCYFEIETVPDTLEEVISILEKNDTVTQIYRVTGKSRLHVHAVSPSQEELEQLLHGTMDHLPGVLECSTNIILSRVKDIKGLRL